MTLRVLLVAGVGKSGSTLLGALLGQIPGYLNVGEVISIEHARQDDHCCGCGAPVEHCAFWGPLITESIGGLDKLNAAEWSQLHTKALISPRLIARNLSRRSNEKDFPQLRALYNALAGRDDGAVIVDGSKSYRYARVLRDLPGIDLHVLHLVRDPRAVEYSKSRLLSKGHWKFAKASTLQNTVQWIALNLLLESMASTASVSYRRLRYEDLVVDPGGVIANVTEWATGCREHLSVDSEGGVFLSENHTLGGSDVRLQSGRVLLGPRDHWLNVLPSEKRRLVTALSLPLLYRYGYPVTRAKVSQL